MLRFVSGNYDEAFLQWCLGEGYPILTTCAYKREMLKRVETMSREEWPSKHLMFDSGAFSAWKSGNEKQLDDLCQDYDHILAKLGSGHYVLYFITLDVIPGTPQRLPTQDEITAAVEQTRLNHEVLLKRFGDLVVPVFRSGDPEEELEEHCARSPVIALSMLQTLNEKNRVRWAEKMIRQAGGRAKLHGLAATGGSMMGLDWFSVDSSSWQQSASFGSILLPRGKTLAAINISDTSPALAQAGKHVANMPECEYIEAMLEARGFSYEELSAEYRKRWEWNCIMYQEWEPTPTIIQGGLFG